MSDPPRRLGTSIRIFLASGEADGVWVVEKSNWTGKALMAPRTRFRDLRSRSDLTGPGIYLLIGPSESELQAHRFYIGETDDLPRRLDDHNRKKDFWNRAIVFTSKDENLNKAHTRYLEARLIGLAGEANRAEMDNANVGSLPPLSEPDEAEAEAFLAEMLLIYPVLGVQVFQKPGGQAASRSDERSSSDEQSPASTRLYLTGQDTKAEGVVTASGMVVYAGALGRMTKVPSLHSRSGRTVNRLREEMRDKGLLVEEGGRLRLTKDYEFSAPSTAAGVLLGRTSNGRVEWKSADGTTLKDLQAAESPT